MSPDRNGRPIGTDISATVQTRLAANEFSGTLIRGRLEILSSDFYNSFADDASVAEALAGVEAAITSLGRKTWFLEAQEALLRGNDDVIDARIVQPDKEIVNRIKLNSDENGAIREAAGIEVGIVVQNLNLVSAANTALTENMISLTPRSPPVQGVFGIMGYQA